MTLLRTTVLCLLSCGAHHAMWGRHHPFTRLYPTDQATQRGEKDSSTQLLTDSFADVMGYMLMYRQPDLYQCLMIKCLDNWTLLKKFYRHWNERSCISQLFYPHMPEAEIGFLMIQWNTLNRTPCLRSKMKTTPVSAATLQSSNWIMSLHRPDEYGKMNMLPKLCLVIAVMNHRRLENSFLMRL